jgi:hypothetical protein
MNCKHLNAALLGLALSASSFVNIANAGIITERWSATVSEVHNSTAYTKGDILQFIFSYNNTATESHIYDKGLDRLAGTQDDTVDFRWNVSDYPNYDVFSDITTNFLDLATPLIDEITTQGFTVHYSSNRYGSTYSHTSNGIAWSDEEITVNTFDGSSAAYAFFTPAFSNGDIITSYMDGGLIINKRIELSSLTRMVALQVPEPSTLVIFALGVAGLVSRRFKKH